MLAKNMMGHPQDQHRLERIKWRKRQKGGCQGQVMAKEGERGTCGGVLYDCISNSFFSLL